MFGQKRRQKLQLILFDLINVQCFKASHWPSLTKKKVQLSIQVKFKRDSNSTNVRLFSQFTEELIGDQLQISRREVNGSHSRKEKKTKQTCTTDKTTRLWGAYKTEFHIIQNVTVWATKSKLKGGKTMHLIKHTRHFSSPKSNKYNRIQFSSPLKQVCQTRTEQDEESGWFKIIKKQQHDDDKGGKVFQCPSAPDMFNTSITFNKPIVTTSTTLSTPACTSNRFHKAGKDKSIQGSSENQTIQDFYIITFKFYKKLMNTVEVPAEQGSSEADLWPAGGGTGEFGTGTGASELADVS